MTAPHLDHASLDTGTSRCAFVLDDDSYNRLEAVESSLKLLEAMSLQSKNNLELPALALASMLGQLHDSLHGALLGAQYRRVMFIDSKAVALN